MTSLPCLETSILPWPSPHAHLDRVCPVALKAKAISSLYRNNRTLSQESAEPACSIPQPWPLPPLQFCSGTEAPESMCRQQAQDVQSRMSPKAQEGKKQQETPPNPSTSRPMHHPSLPLTPPSPHKRSSTLTQLSSVCVVHTKGHSRD